MSRGQGHVARPHRGGVGGEGVGQPQSMPMTNVSHSMVCTSSHRTNVKELASSGTARTHDEPQVTLDNL
jgi:hypothetical protein